MELSEGSALCGSLGRLLVFLCSQRPPLPRQRYSGPPVCLERPPLAHCPPTPTPNCELSSTTKEKVALIQQDTYKLDAEGEEEEDLICLISGGGIRHVKLPGWLHPPPPTGR